MSLLSLAALGVLCLAGAGSAKHSNSTVVDERWCGVEQTTCGLHDDDGPWMAMLQQWALETHGTNERHGRIMALPPAQGYYVSDRMDGTLLPPPPPPHSKHPNHPQHQPPLPAGARPYDEWQHAPPLHSGKIVNRPPNPYKDKFKPSYPAPVQNQPIPVHSSGLDRVDENRQPPQKQVSETDLYLLGAIEKLVWRADIMEKRLRKIEETIHYMVAGNDAKPEPCGENYTRVGGGCYHISSDNANWKGASYACRKLKGHMLELDSDAERDSLANNLFGDNKGSKGSYRYKYRRNQGKPPQMCSLEKCIWLYKYLRTLLYLTIASIAYTVYQIISDRMANGVITYNFAKISLKLAKKIHLSPLFPMQKMTKRIPK
ncbi:uncharacterized protein LOC110377652 isoform X2 [Helicoverpa armigera]|uniref:uncharacterized protein LOC110377652 isoform X2 n=1 Tax=Helicoverpa armigera TaxID=29058 RepID=UPI0030838E25